jgi:hypothetical protein
MMLWYGYGCNNIGNFNPAHLRSASFGGVEEVAERVGSSKGPKVRVPVAISVNCSHMEQIFRGCVDLGHINLVCMCFTFSVAADACMHIEYVTADHSREMQA